MGQIGNIEMKLTNSNARMGFDISHCNIIAFKIIITDFLIGVYLMDAIKNSRYHWNKSMQSSILYHRVVLLWQIVREFL